MMMTANASHANKRNQEQEGPLRKAAAHCRNLAAIADGSVNGVLIEHLHIALRLLWRDVGPGD